LHAGRHAIPLSKTVTFYTNGSAEVAAQIEGMLGGASQVMKVDTRTIKKLVKSPNKAEVIVQFEDGSEVTEGFLGHAPMTKAQGPFADQLGIEMTPMGDVKTTQPFPQTNVTGVFAAGDAASPMKVILNAQFMGSLAGSGVSSQLIADEYQQSTMF
jgi:gliotoxin/aspirochlorine biosynthesis thioredoxin reductase